MKAALLLAVLAAIAPGILCVNRYQPVYAGFDHLLVFETQQDDVRVEAMDYRRMLPKHSTCDIFAQPPLLSGVKVKDWLIDGVINSTSGFDVTYTAMGYEIFLEENKFTGAYVLRRCRDFRPQLEELPCEAVATGTSPQLAKPYKTVYLGNNRVMILNTRTGEFRVHPFDADVHTGGDPFKFSSGPLLTGVFPITKGLAQLEFSYLQMKDHGGDLLVAHDPTVGSLEAFRFHGQAMKNDEFKFESAVTKAVMEGFTVTSIGQDQILLFKQNYDYEIWHAAVNGTRIILRTDHKGRVAKEHNCFHDSATACVLTDGCAWCPTTRTCHNYDMHNNAYCDSHACQEAPVINDIEKANKLDTPLNLDDPEVNLPEADAHAIVMDDTPAGLAGDMRLESSYRGNDGAHAHAEAAPVHPHIDNELGDDPEVATAPDDKPNEMIHTDNRVAKGVVYTPPGASKASPCMDNGYDANNAADEYQPTVAIDKMNTAYSKPRVLNQSPPGVMDQANEEHVNCARASRNNELPRPQKVQEDKFVPRPAAEPAQQDVYAPASVVTRREEDLMNEEKTIFSDLKARWLEDAAPQETAKTLIKKTDVPFRPREPELVPKEALLVPAPVIREAPKDEAARTDAMNQGIETDGLAGADCSETGGNDGKSRPTFASAMMNSERDAMPRTLEQQLALFSHEPRHTTDMMPIVKHEEPLPIVLPTSPRQYLPDPVPRQVTNKFDVGTADAPTALMPESQRVIAGLQPEIPDGHETMLNAMKLDKSILKIQTA